MTALPLLLAAFGLLVLPGAAIGAVAGARWRDAVAVGPALTLAVVAVGAAITAAADVRWGPVSAAAATLVALVCAGAVGLAGRASVRVAGRRRRSDDGNGIDDAVHRSENGNANANGKNDDDKPRRLPNRSSKRRGSVWPQRVVRPGIADLVVVVLSLIPLLQITVATRGLSAIPQYWDAIFHGAATRWIAETGRAGLTDLSQISQPANSDFFYPDTYHAFASLLIAVPGVAMPGPLNAVSAATGAVFVLGSAVLAGRLCGGSRLAAVATAVAAACAWTFPFGVLDRGPLLPFALGVAVIPGLLVVGDRVASGCSRIVAHALLLSAGIAGAWSVHPSVAVAAAVPIAVQALAGLFTGGAARAPGLWPRLVILGGFALAAVPGALYPLWTTTMISGGTADALAGFSWPRHQTVPQAIAGVLDLGPTPLASVGIGTAVLVGLVAAFVVPQWRRTLVAPAAALVVFGGLYVLAASVHGDWVRIFTGLWWDDAHRFAALLTLPAVVLAGAGVRAMVPRGSVRRPSAKAGVAVAMVLGLLAVSGQAAVVPDLRANGYADGPAVTADERTVIDELGARYAGGTALNDPFDGTAWAYALHGVPMLFPAPLADDPAGQLGPERMHLYTSMNRYGFDPTVTQVVHDLDVRWVIVGTGVVGGPGRPAGFIGLRFNPNLELVAESPGARLYRVLPVASDHAPLPPPPPIPPFTPAEQPPNTDSPLVDAAPASSGTSLDGATGP